MPKYARKPNKKAVARYATPDQLSILHPPPASLSALIDAKSVLESRHSGDVTWRVISWELGGVNKGTLFRVANGSRQPSNKLIAKLNSAYGCHLRPSHVKIIVSPCPNCGAIPGAAKHRCPQSTSKYKPHPVMRLSKLKRLHQSPYNAA